MEEILETEFVRPAGGPVRRVLQLLERRRLEVLAESGGHVGALGCHCPRCHAAFVCVCVCVFVRIDHAVGFRHMETTFFDPANGKKQTGLFFFSLMGKAKEPYPRPTQRV